MRYLKPFINTYIHQRYSREDDNEGFNSDAMKPRALIIDGTNTYIQYIYIHTYIHTFTDRKYNAQYIHIIVITPCLFILHLPIGPSLLLALADDAPGGLKGMLLEVNAAYIHIHTYKIYFVLSSIDALTSHSYIIYTQTKKHTYIHTYIHINRYLNFAKR